LWVAHTYGHSDRNIHTHTDCDGDCNLYAYSDSNGNGYSNCDCYRGAEVYANAQAASHGPAAAPISSSVLLVRFGNSRVKAREFLFVDGNVKHPRCA